MVKPFPLILLILAGFVVTKILLTAYWARLLHRRHGSRYSYFLLFWNLLFWKMLLPGWAVGDQALWKDLKIIIEWEQQSIIILFVLWIAILFAVAGSSSP